MDKDKLVKEITAIDDDFSKWYSDICVKAELMAYSDLQGFIIYLPKGYAIWERIKEYLDNEFKKTNHKNVYFPLLIPEGLFQKEKDHIKGFAPEAAMVTTTGVNDLSERLIIRPTSEILFSNFYKTKVKSYRDLPILYNQWCSVLRWEKTTRPFLRGKEFLWQEGHTVHESKEDAISETLRMLEIYNKMGKELLAIPFICGKKTENEKFAGAVATYSIEALMKDGKALQSGTSHYFGQNFSKPFDIKFTNKENKLEYAYQTSWGATTRLIGAIIMMHGDSDGLVLPPRIAPTQVAIIPVGISEDDLNLLKIKNSLEKNNIRYMVDFSNKSMGYKFSEAEMNGIPIRITAGKNELKNNEVTIFKRNTREKFLLKIDELDKKIPELLDTIHNEMYEKAKKFVTDHTTYVKTYDEFKEVLLKNPGYIKLDCNIEAEKIIKDSLGATARIILDEKPELKKCPITGKKVDYRILFAKAY